MPHNHSTFKGLVTLENNQPITTSLKISEVFGKLHKDVIRKLENLDCSAQFNGRNFTLVDFLDKKGEVRKAYSMTKDGFMFLVMSFTGEKAAQIKEDYINAFNTMQNELSGNTGQFNNQLQNEQQLLQQVNYQRKQMADLGDALLVASPLLNNLNRYSFMGLNRYEIGLLINQNDQVIDESLEQLYRLGITARPAYSEFNAIKALQNKRQQRIKQTKARAIAELKQIEQEFADKTKAVILLNPNINKSELLTALGKKKDDKTARALLDLFDGEYWLGTKKHGVFAYNLVDVSQGGEA